jgi:hypothetical protein
MSVLCEVGVARAEWYKVFRSCANFVTDLSIYLILIDYSCKIIFHSNGDITIAGEMMPIFGQCSALRAFEQEGIFIGPRLL